MSSAKGCPCHVAGLDSGTTWQSLGNTFAIASDPVWVDTFVDGTFSADSSVLLRLLNDQSDAGGNDFSLDDLFFGTVTDTTPSTVFTGLRADDVSATGSTIAPVREPSTWALGISFSIAVTGLDAVEQRGDGR